MTNLGVALGGGSTRGAAHVGALRALEEAGRTPTCIAGTSAGALVGAFYAAGLPLDEIERIALDLDWLDVARPVLPRMGLLSNAKLGELLQSHLGDPDLSSLERPLAIVATDIQSGEEVVMDQGPLISAVLASTCIPGLFAPVERGGRLLVDGGLVNDVPVRPARALGADAVIAVDLNAATQLEPVSNLVDVLENTLRIAMREGSEVRSREADLRVALDLSFFSPLKTGRAEELIQEGYRATRASLASWQGPDRD